MGAQEPAAGSAIAGRSVALRADDALAVARLYADYAAALDEARYEDWVALFAPDCRYLVQPRENHDRGLPLATMALEDVSRRSTSTTNTGPTSGGQGLASVSTSHVAARSGGHGALAVSAASSAARLPAPARDSTSP